MMDRDELLKLIDAGDDYGLLLVVVRAWLEKRHPESQYATVCADMGGDRPSLVLPVFQSALLV